MVGEPHVDVKEFLSADLCQLTCVSWDNELANEANEH